MGAVIQVCVLGALEGELNSENWELWLGNLLLLFYTCQYQSPKLLPKLINICHFSISRKSQQVLSSNPPPNPHHPVQDPLFLHHLISISELQTYEPGIRERLRVVVQE